MRAAWYTSQGPAREVLEIGEIEAPIPKPGEVRVRIHTSGAVSYTHLTLPTNREV